MDFMFFFFFFERKESEKQGKEEEEEQMKKTKKIQKNSHLCDLDERLLALELLQVEPLDLGLGGLAPLPDGGAEVTLMSFFFF